MPGTAKPTAVSTLPTLSRRTRGTSAEPCWLSHPCTACGGSAGTVERGAQPHAAARQREPSALRAAITLALVALASVAVAQGCTPHHFLEVVAPDGATGGLPFETQPAVCVYDEDGQVCDALDGTTVEVNIGNNPSGLGMCLGPNFATVTIANGCANFTGVLIDIADKNYTVIYWGETMWLESTPFCVEVGPPAQLVIRQQPGSITGGEEFRPQPVLEIQDAGGNVWDGDSESRISVAIEDNPPGDGELSFSYIPLGQDHWGEWRRARCVEGVCPFLGLTIDKAGIDYTLRFELEENEDTHNLTVAQRVVISNPFTVGIGPTAAMTVETQPSGARGGEPFDSQPCVALRDAGGNINEHDDTSRVTVSFAINEAGAQLHPEFVRTVIEGNASLTNGSPYAMTWGFNPEDYFLEGDFVEFGTPDPRRWTGDHVSPWQHLTLYPQELEVRIVPDEYRIRLQEPWPYRTANNLTVTRVESAVTRRVTDGQVCFDDLRIDYIGRDYQLRFTVSHLTPTHAYTTPGVFVDSDPFDVTLGAPAQLAVTRGAGDAWANGQPFGIQPIVEIQDAGGNTITDISEVIIVQAELINTTAAAGDQRNATLLGNVTRQEVHGVAEFTDLEIDVRGFNYTILFNTTLGNFTTTDTFHVGWSAEWQVMNQDAYRDDNFGQSVDVDGTLAVVGAHKEDRLVREVQTVTTTGTADMFVEEIQSIRTFAVAEEMVQVFTTTADPGETIGGHFQLSFGDVTKTEQLPFDAYGELVKVHLENDIDGTGEVTVTRSSNDDACGCTGSYSWSVTFRHLVDEQPEITADVSALTGTNAAISTEVVVPSTIIDGVFSLTIPETSLTGGGNLTTRAIPYNALEEELEAIIEADLLTGPVTVSRSDPDSQRGYTWSVTFNADYSNYDVPQLVPHFSGLTGNGATAYVATHREGLSPLGGYFQLYFRDVGPTAQLAFDASAQDMVDALEALATIDTVWVERSEPTPERGYVWTITFVQVRYLTDETDEPREGFVMDALNENLPALTVQPWQYEWAPDGSAGGVDGMLLGTGAHIEIDHIYNVADDPPWEQLAMGAAGEEAGAIYIYNRTSGEMWTQEQKLRGHDTDEYNHFGFAVAMDDGTIIAGAPHAKFQGVEEQQEIDCQADAGTFTVTWRTHTTAAIAFDATAAELKAALELLPVLHEVTVDTSASATDAVCDGAGYTTTVTFNYPLDGDQPALEVDGTLLTDGGGAATITVTDDVVQGTRKPHGADSTRCVVGAAYVFTLDDATGVWSEETKLLDLESHRDIGDEFGWDVAVSGDWAWVSAPNDANTGIDEDLTSERVGSVVVYKRTGSDWAYHQRLSHFDRTQGNRFGHAISLDGDNGLVASLGYDGGQGCVHMFKRNPVSSTELYLYDQVFVPPGTPSPVASFGADVSIDLNVMTIGAPGMRDDAGDITGVVYVYDREETDEAFELRNTLRPTPAKPLERVGITTEVDGNVVAVGSLAGHTGPAPGPRYEVQEIKTRASSTPADNEIGNFFKLGWRRGTDGTLVTTREIESDATAANLRAILQEDLGTGPIRVNRMYPTAQQGYRWLVTFMSPSPDAPFENQHFPLFTPLNYLTGNGATLTVEYANVAPPTIWGAVYIYTREPTGAFGGFGVDWQEQAVLEPWVHQPADMFGAALGMKGSTVIVGAPNRDSFVSGENSGAAFMFDLALLNLRFEQRTYDVDENSGTFNVNILRCDSACRVTPTPPLHADLAPEQLAQFSTADGNDWGTYRFPPSHLNGYHYDRIPAVGREDCRYPFSAGNDDCLWTASHGFSVIKSAYDYRAESDFVPYHTELVIDAWSDDPSTTVMPVHVVNDKVLESPDEVFHLRLWAPGYQPMLGGDGWSTLTIVDDGDGGQGSRGYYDKVFPAEESEDAPAAAQFGFAVAVDSETMIVGAPQATDPDDSDNTGSGLVYAFTRTSGLWVREGTLPRTGALNARFGSGVALHNDVAAIGAVGGVTVSMYARTPPTGSVAAVWTLEAELTPSDPVWDPIRPESRFGAEGAVAIASRVVCVGARNAEAVFVFRDPDGDGGSWQQTAILRASHYRDLVWLTTRHHFRQHFGASVAMSDHGMGITLVVGAPMGNYQGGDLPDPTTYAEVEAMQSHALGYGRGRVYMWEFNSTTDSSLYGTAHWYNWERIFHWPEADAWVQDGVTGYPHFVDDDAGGMWGEQAFFTPADAAAQDRFGEAVDIDNNQVIVGAFGSGGQPQTTWDFETGDLTGWETTGYAFLQQPTYGDNTAHRTVEVTAEGPVSQTAGHRGNFWIGTAEARPANSSLLPTADAGTAAGDLLQGTMTSQPFRIAGNAISLLVGGGCNERLEYVELVVDGAPDVRATGACRETMQRVYWDVTAHKGRSAQIRMVDASSDGWGHINVDDIRFAWDMQEYSETPQTGAAYTYRRRENGTEEPCSEYVMRCEWEYQAKLVPGDKRPHTHFGWSVAVDDETGTAVVGAPFQDNTRPDWANPGSHADVRIGTFGNEYSFRADGGINNGDVGGTLRTIWGDDLSPYLHGHGSSHGSINSVGRPSAHEQLAFDSLALGGSGARGSTGRHFGSGHRTTSANTNGVWDNGNPWTGLGHMWDRQTNGDVLHPHDPAEGGVGRSTISGPATYASGAVYVFRRVPEIRDGYDRLLFEPHWPVAHQAVLPLPGAKANDQTGLAVDTTGFTAVIGSPMDSTMKGAAGSVTVVDTEYQRVYIEFEEYVVSEDYHYRRLTIRVMREGDLSGYLDVAYSTRDVTAFGMNQTRATECFTTAMNIKGATIKNTCGDYTQTSGVLNFLPTENFRSFTVNIHDDNCYEHEPERFVVQLAIPGEVPIRGEGYQSVVRIDDDDHGLPACVYPHPPTRLPHLPDYTQYSTDAYGFYDHFS